MVTVDDNELYPIGDVARRTGLSVSAIRFYADAGVVPATGHTDAGHRLYDVQAIARLDLVRTLRELDAGLDEIRRVLADESTLRDLAAAHLALVERQGRRLRAKRAVLRTIVRQDSTAGQVSLLHKLVSMSDGDRDRLVDLFWDEVCDGLDVHPDFVVLLHGMRPTLPEDPTADQLEAWIDLVDLVRDDDFRRSVRRYFHDTFTGVRALRVTTPPVVELIERHRQVEVEVWEAWRSGLPVDSTRARDVVDRLVVSTAEFTAEFTGEHDVDGVRRRMAAPDRTNESYRRGEEAASRFTGVLDRYLSLTATINGTPRPDPAEEDGTEEWIAAVLAARVPGEE